MMFLNDVLLAALRLWKLVYLFAVVALMTGCAPMIQNMVESNATPESMGVSTATYRNYDCAHFPGLLDAMTKGQQDPSTEPFQRKVYGWHVDAIRQVQREKGCNGEGGGIAVNQRLLMYHYCYAADVNSRTTVSSLVFQRGTFGDSNSQSKLMDALQSEFQRDVLLRYGIKEKASCVTEDSMNKAQVSRDRHRRMFGGIDFTLTYIDVSWNPRAQQIAASANPANIKQGSVDNSSVDAKQAAKGNLSAKAKPSTKGSSPAKAKQNVEKDLPVNASQGVQGDATPSPKTPGIGVRMSVVSDELAQALRLPPREGKGGVLVVEVIKGGNAERAGLRQMDVILYFGGYPVYKPIDLAQLASQDAGLKRRLRIWRDGAEQDLMVEVGPPLDANLQVGATKASQAQTPRTPGIGVKMLEVSEELAQMLHLPSRAGGGGVWVDEVIQGGNAERAGLRKMDVILYFGDSPVYTPDDLRQVVAQSTGLTKRVRIWRDGAGQDLMIEVGAPPSSGETLTNGLINLLNVIPW
ncbi:PDZ domain-containing protein [Chitinibacter sp. S2-10]|uniref:PDZ domain-containing protein n=1 Tax=Chitinibacter sp. S2-10 TaxID=3373597 RepID=UPI00397785C8